MENMNTPANIPTRRKQWGREGGIDEGSSREGSAIRVIVALVAVGGMIYAGGMAIYRMVHESDQPPIILINKEPEVDHSPSTSGINISNTAVGVNVSIQLNAPVER